MKNSGEYSVEKNSYSSTNSDCKTEVDYSRKTNYKTTSARQLSLGLDEPGQLELDLEKFE